eukprot:CAMPEP_0114494466 /NCGR_PEP_ID=MMETSP0109-20121206/4668_1 /TAXON_ID=29199 /ORGANISM="Chlorarachnion reptans, Strain CCCM449" /LENGTH=453 /DNA_ID=CAMNT_0001671507 /DNA_START=122 /DNA_END=1483 /DNA_ORIENTATION=-
MTWLEHLFGEKRHQTNPSREITSNFLLVSFSSFVAQGAYDEGFWNGVRFFSGSVATLNMYSWIPWIPKLLYAACSDMIPICGYRRKWYIFLGSIVTGLSVGLAGLHGLTFNLQAIYMVIGCTASAWANVAVDALVVERSQDKDALVAARLQAFVKTAYGTGMVLSDIVFGFAIDWYHPRVTYYLFAFFQIVTAFFALVLDEKRVTPDRRDLNGSRISEAIVQVGDLETATVKRQFLLVFQTLMNPRIFFPVTVLTTLLSMPVASEALRIYFVEELHFSASFLGVMDAACTICGGAGLIIWAGTIADSGMRGVFVWTTVGVILCNLWLFLVTGVNRRLGINDKLFVFSDKMVNNVASAICSNAIYTYAACICPKGIEGMTFAAMTGLFNLGGAVSALLSAWFIDWFDVHCDEDTQGNLYNCRFEGLWKLVTMTAVSNLFADVHWLGPKFSSKSP